jgi:hypothetical protein
MYRSGRRRADTIAVPGLSRPSATRLRLRALTGLVDRLGSSTRPHFAGVGAFAGAKPFPVG